MSEPDRLRRGPVRISGPGCGGRWSRCRYGIEGKASLLKRHGDSRRPVMRPAAARYLDTAVNQLRVEGFDVRDEDVSSLSPFVGHHIDMLGRYSFQFPGLPGRRSPASRAGTSPSASAVRRPARRGGSGQSGGIRAELVGAGLPVHGLPSSRDWPRRRALVRAPFALTGQRRPARSTFSMFTPRICAVRPAVSSIIRHGVFSRRCTARRAISRSTAIFERARVSESGTASRFAQEGLTG